MAKILSKFIKQDPQSIETDGSDNLRLKVDPAGGLQRSVNGAGVQPLGITNSMLAGLIQLSKLLEGTELVKRDGSVPFINDVDFGGNRALGLGYPVAPTDAASKDYVDSAIVGVQWNVVSVPEMVDDSDMSGTPPVVVDPGVSYVVNNWGMGFTDGDIVESDGLGGWNVIVTNAGGFVPNLTKVVVTATIADVPAGSFAGQSRNIAVADGAGAWNFEVPTQSSAVFVIGAGAYMEQNAFLYDPDASKWFQFTGAGQINAGNGLQKAGNTLSVKPKVGGGLGADASGVYIDDLTGVFSKIVDPVTYTVDMALAEFEASQKAYAFIYVTGACSAVTPVTVTKPVVFIGNNVSSILFNTAVTASMFAFRNITVSGGTFTLSTAGQIYFEYATFNAVAGTAFLTRTNAFPMFVYGFGSTFASANSGQLFTAAHTGGAAIQSQIILERCALASTAGAYLIETTGANDNVRLLAFDDTVVGATSFNATSGVLEFAYDASCTLNAARGTATSETMLDKAELMYYDNSLSGLAAGDVQAALDEIAALAGGGSMYIAAISGAGVLDAALATFTGSAGLKSAVFLIADAQVISAPVTIAKPIRFIGTNPAAAIDYQAATLVHNAQVSFETLTLTNAAATGVQYPITVDHGYSASIKFVDVTAYTDFVNATFLRKVDDGKLYIEGLRSGLFILSGATTFVGAVASIGVPQVVGTFWQSWIGNTVPGDGFARATGSGAAMNLTFVDGTQVYAGTQLVAASGGVVQAYYDLSTTMGDTGAGGATIALLGRDPVDRNVFRATIDNTGGADPYDYTSLEAALAAFAASSTVWRSIELIVRGTAAALTTARALTVPLTIIGEGGTTQRADITLSNNITTNAPVTLANLRVAGTGKFVLQGVSSRVALNNCYIDASSGLYKFQYDSSFGGTDNYAFSAINTTVNVGAAQTAVFFDGAASNPARVFLDNSGFVVAGGGRALEAYNCPVTMFVTGISAVPAGSFNVTGTGALTVYYDASSIVVTTGHGGTAPTFTKADALSSTDMNGGALELTNLGAPTADSSAARLTEVKARFSAEYTGIVSTTWATTAALLAAGEADYTARETTLSYPLAGGTVTVTAGDSRTFTKPLTVYGKNPATDILQFTNNGIAWNITTAEFLKFMHLGIVKGHSQTTFQCNGNNAQNTQLIFESCVLTDNSSGTGAVANAQYRSQLEMTVRDGSINFGYTKLIDAAGNAATFTPSPILRMERVPVTLAGNARLMNLPLSGSKGKVFLTNGCSVPANAFECVAGATIDVYYDDTCQVVQTGAGAGTVNFYPVTALDCVSNKRSFTAYGALPHTGGIDSLNNGVEYVDGVYMLDANFTQTAGQLRTITKDFVLTGLGASSKPTFTWANGAIYTMTGSKLVLKNINFSMPNITNGGWLWGNSRMMNLELYNVDVAQTNGPATFTKDLRGGSIVKITGGTHTIADGKMVFRLIGATYTQAEGFELQAEKLTITQSGTTGRFLTHGNYGTSNLYFRNGCVFPKEAFEAAAGTTINVFYDDTCTVTGAAGAGAGTVTFTRIPTKSQWVAQTTNFSAVAFGAYIVDTNAGAVTATLPASPALGDTIRFLDGAGTWGTNNVTLARNGQNIMGVAADYPLDVSEAGVTLVFYDTTNGWRIM